MNKKKIVVFALVILLSGISKRVCAVDISELQAKKNEIKESLS